MLRRSLTGDRTQGRDGLHEWWVRKQPGGTAPVATCGGIITMSDTADTGAL